jgi:hypothetical protein
MAQTGYTPILIYSSSTTTNAPAAGNLTNSTLGSELAINITDGKLFYKDNANAVQVIAWKVTPTTAGGTGLTSYTAGDLLYYASGTTLTKLAIGASGRWLGSSGTAPQWNAPAALTKTDDTNVTLTLGGSASTALLNAASLTLGWTGTLAVSRGGTGTGTAFTAGSVIFAGASGVYSQDNANFFWDNTNKRLGIGLATPETRLQVLASGGTGGEIRIGTNAADLGTSTLTMFGFTNEILFKHRNIGTTLAGVAGYPGNFGTDSSGYLTLSTQTAAGTYAERARVTSAGSLLVGTTTERARGTFVAGATENGFWVENDTYDYQTLTLWNKATANDNRFVYFGTEGTITVRGSITYNRGAGLVAYNTSSDYRSKDILGSVENALETVKSLKPYVGKMKGATIARPMFIAHEAQQIAPYSVTGEKDAVDTEGNAVYQQIDHSSFVPLLVAAIQELKNELDLLKTNATAQN